MDLLIFLSCKGKTNILKNLTKENLHLNPPPPPPHTHTLSPRDLVISWTQSEIIFRHHPIKTEAPCQCWKLPESNFMYFTALTFKFVPSIFDLVLTYHLVYSLTVILLHFPCFLRPDAQSPCQNAREGVGNIKRKKARYYFFTQWLAFTDDNKGGIHCFRSLSKRVILKRSAGSF